MLVLITGASKGIGKFLLERFEEQTERWGVVSGTFYSTESNKENLTRVNVADNRQVGAWIDSLDMNPKIVLINCAGINYNSFAHKADPEQWKKVIETNLTGTFNVINAVLPKMRAAKWGRIINLSSVVAQTMVSGTSAYSASKAGLWGMVKSIATENAAKGITINNLNLGYYDIGMIKEVPKEYQEILKSKIPTGKFGDPMQIYNAINFLIENDYVNGTSIDMNGGLY